MYAWVLDEIDEERKRCVTIDIARTKHVVLLDAPEHRDFISNMIIGMSLCLDFAVLLVRSFIYLQIPHKPTSAFVVKIRNLCESQFYYALRWFFSPKLCFS